MAIDSSIYSNIQQPKPVNMLAEYANLMQVQGAQQANKLNQLKFDAYQREQEDNNALRSALSAPGADPYNALLRMGRVKEATEYRKSQTDAKKVDSDISKNDVETEHKTIGIYRDASHSITDPQSAIAFVQMMHSDPRLKNSAIARVPLDQALAQIPQDPAQFEGWKKQFALGAQKFIDLNKPTIATRNLGGTTDTIATEGLTGATRVVNSAQNTVSPDAQLSAQTSTANNQRSVGAQYANAAATREIAGATRDAARIKANQDVEMKLGDDYRTQSKGFKEVSDAYRTINATLDKATTSPAATLAGATKFMKLLDPGSVVRESELGMALAAAGVLDRAANYFNTLRSGKVLTANQVADFKNITGQIYQAAQQGQQQLDAHYRQQAKTYGLRPEMIVQDLGQNTSAPVDLGSLPAGGGKVVDFGSLK